MNPERDKKIVERYLNSNDTQEKIGEEWGITKQGVSAILRKHGIKGRTITRKEQYKEKASEVMQYATSLLSRDAIAAKVGVSGWFVDTVFKENKVDRSIYRSTKGKYERITEYVKGHPEKTYAQCAKDLNISTTTLSRALKENNFRRGVRYNNNKVITLIQYLNQTRGFNASMIARELNTMEVPALHGQKWHPKVISSIIRRSDREGPPLKPGRNGLSSQILQESQR